jgi:hypothetical protein
MKRLHIHISVNELAESIQFYSILFNATPSVEHNDYAKWDLSEPAVNFAISSRSDTHGVNHLGIQVDSDNELEEMAERLDKAEINLSKQEGVSCCYARSNKHWTLDPQGVSWESFYSLGQSSVFNEDTVIDDEDKKVCCIPLDTTQAENPKEAPCCVSTEDGTSGCCR